MLPTSPTLSEIRDAVVHLMPGPHRGAAAEEKEAWETAARREMALYSSLGPDLRAAVDKRLRAIAGLPASRRAKDVADAAEVIGLGQSAMYGLLKRVADLGPISGLVPGRRKSSKPSAARDGFGSPIDDWIETSMSDRPDISIADVGKWIAAEIQNLQLEGKTAPKAPATSALRERVHALRSRRPELGPLQAGAELLIDQCPLSLAISVPEEGAGAAKREGTRAAKGLFVVDRRTTLILGVGLFVEGRAAVGLTSALEDFSSRVEGLEANGLLLQETPAKVNWVVPPVLVPQIAEVRAIALHSRTSVICTLGRSGAELTKLVGERLGPYRLLPRGVPDDFPREPGEGMRQVDIRSSDMDLALDSLRFEVDRRNSQIVGEAVGQKDRSVRASCNVRPYARLLKAIFAPVRELGTAPAQ